MPKKGQILHKNRIGEKFVIVGGYEAEIINYRGALDLDVLLNDGTIIEKVFYDNLRKGSLTDAGRIQSLSL